jgi:hypothetical protein
MKKITALMGALLLAAGIAAFAPAPAHASVTCGIWRWPVKTGSDADRFKVNRTYVETSIGYLDSRHPPSSFTAFAQDHRIHWVEFHTWRLFGSKLLAIKLESDGDIHLQLRTKSGSDRMIAEVPDPRCVSSRSLWRSQIASARTYLLGRYSVSQDHWTSVNRPVAIQGLGFFDEEHGVTGAAPNDVELHPVIHIRFVG